MFVYLCSVPPNDPKKLCGRNSYPDFRSFRKWSIGWRRGSHCCRVPVQPCKHGKRAKPRKADRGISKALSNILLRSTGVFLSVGPGMYVKIYFIFRLGDFLCIIEKETERFRIVNTFRMTASTLTSMVQS